MRTYRLLRSMVSLRFMWNRDGCGYGWTLAADAAVRAAQERRADWLRPRRLISGQYQGDLGESKTATGSEAAACLSLLYCSWFAFMVFEIRCRLASTCRTST
jgi:hypothetical protein